MNRIPIVFCFNDNWVLQAGVCLTSLLVNANENTFYDIFILHSEQCAFKDSLLNELPLRYGNCTITFRCVGKEFENAFIIRGITIDTYYRMLIPIVIPEYDKIIYSDVDVIFRKDLSHIFESTDLTDYYIAGVVDPSSHDEENRNYLKRLHLIPEDYIYAGNIIINSKRMREDGIVQKLIHEANSSTYKYQDMDIINIVCKGRIKKISPEFCLSIHLRKSAIYQEDTYYSKQELAESMKGGIIHYNGPKPWIQFCPDFDIWWEYYRKSIFFDPKFHFDFFHRRINAYDLLPLRKRIKILARWFLNK